MAEPINRSLEHLAFMTAIYRIAIRHHSGQWSRGYRLLCYSAERVRKYHSALDVGRVCEALDLHTKGPFDPNRPEPFKYHRHSLFRDRVAYYMLKIRHWRSRL